MEYCKLTENQKADFKRVCDSEFGSTNVFSENNEPLYFDNNSNMISNNEVIKLIFLTNLN